MKNIKLLFVVFFVIILCGLGSFFGHLLNIEKLETEQLIYEPEDSSTITQNKDVAEIEDDDIEAINYIEVDVIQKNNEYVFDPTSIPIFCGSPYVEINNNIPNFRDDEINNKEFEIYSEFDELGRCGVAYANISLQTMPTEERGEIGQIRPSGWHTVKYNDLIDGNYLYNRCHLIGYQLAGENANEKNLITGTRYLNVIGMLTFENMVANYVQNTGNHVLYRVTPIFEKDNLVASGVTMEALSVEDYGKGICFYVFVYNVQPGIIIDYATGDSHREVDLAVEGESSEDDELILFYSYPEDSYVLNTNTKKFHHTYCDSVNDMKEKNKQISTESREQIIDKGYTPCKRCNP